MRTRGDVAVQLPPRQQPRQLAEQNACPRSETRFYSGIQLLHAQSVRPVGGSVDISELDVISKEQQSSLSSDDGECSESSVVFSPTTVSAGDTCMTLAHPHGSHSVADSVNQQAHLYHQISTPRIARFAPNSTCSFLKPGAKFEGTQYSLHSKYDVQVELQHVDMANSFLCGYLKIRGLTEDHPSLTTYFESEIIGTRYTFQTKHTEWGSSEKEDLAHWARFPAWKPLSPIVCKRPNFTSKSFSQREHLFMRWKEQFLVPDYTVRTINGASFEGFYYICFNQVTGHISGIYFHSGNERYEQLELRHVPDNGCLSAFEFR